MAGAMLPKGIGNVRLQDTCIEAKSFLLGNSSNLKDATKGLLELDIESRSVFIETIKIGGRKSAFFEACQLGSRLQATVSDFLRENDQKWEIISNVWLHMLKYGAGQCSWKEHARQLQQGEELLTHVALLMVHLGLSKEIELVTLPERLEQIEFKPRFYWDKLDRLAYYLA